MRLGIRTAAAYVLLVIPLLGARLSSSARSAFDGYVGTLETRLARQHADGGSCLAVLDVPRSERTAAEQQLKTGTLRIEPVNGGLKEVSGGLIHHWRGAAFVPGAGAKDMLRLLRDYKHLPDHYAPEIVSASVLFDHVDAAKIAVRMKEQKGVAVVLDAEYDLRTELPANGCGHSYSRSSHIWEVGGILTGHERRRPEGNDDGFLWRLNSYWSFAQVPGGLLIECEAVSLTRDIPAGLGWLVTPIIQDFPRESLEFTLRATEKALTENMAREAHR